MKILKIMGIKNNPLTKLKSFKEKKGEPIKLSLLWKRISIIALLLILIYGLGYAQDDKELYSKAVNAARTKDSGFAYMYFKEILSEFPDSRYRPEAIFASGEYYFSVNNYSYASEFFTRFVTDYPDSKAEIFALAYLLKIAEIRGQEASVKELKDLIINSKRLILVFKEFKVSRYNSALQNKYKAIYYIDKIEFYINGELFEKISF